MAYKTFTFYFKKGHRHKHITYFEKISRVEKMLRDQNISIVQDRTYETKSKIKLIYDVIVENKEINEDYVQYRKNVLLIHDFIDSIDIR